MKLNFQRKKVLNNKLQKNRMFSCGFFFSFKGLPMNVKVYSTSKTKEDIKI